MEGNTDTSAHRQATTQIVRIAWFLTFVLPLVLAALLLGVKSAQAAPGLPGITPLAFEEFEGEGEDEGEEFEGELELEACETAEEEFEEGELSEAAAEAACDEVEGEGSKKATGSNSVAPEECILRSAHAQAVAASNGHSLKLTVGYTAYEPATASVDYSATGGKGSVHLSPAKRHLGRSGVIRLSSALSDADMAKVQAAGNFSVRLHVAGAPKSCRRFELERLTVKHVSKRHAIWSQRD